jgi:GNAT superfamily N-acetyltransferase
MNTDRIPIDVSLHYQTTRELAEDHDSFILSIDGEIFGRTAHEDGPEIGLKLGDLETFLIRVGNAVDAGASLSIILDSCQQTFDIGCALFSSSFEDYSPWIKRRFEDAYPWDDILILDRLTLDPAARGQRLGLAVLDQAIRDWSGGCSLVAIKPFPLQYEGGGRNMINVADLKLEEFIANKTESFRRLRGYYTQLGFERIGRSDIYALYAKDKRPSLKDLSIPDEFTLPAEFVRTRARTSKEQ